MFSGLAHWIKGGVFFWYGILTLGRWAGCFADIGWAWNVRPSQSGRRVTAEFVESFLIFVYGSTNVFLEHLAAWGSEWSAQDLEHISITVMFFGGGLVRSHPLDSQKIRKQELMIRTVWHVNRIDHNSLAPQCHKSNSLLLALRRHPRTTLLPHPNEPPTSADNPPPWPHDEFAPPRIHGLDNDPLAMGYPPSRRRIRPRSNIHPALPLASNLLPPRSSTHGVDYGFCVDGWRGDLHE